MSQVPQCEVRGQGWRQRADGVQVYRLQPWVTDAAGKRVRSPEWAAWIAFYRGHHEHALARYLEAAADVHFVVGPDPHRHGADQLAALRRGAA